MLTRLNQQQKDLYKNFCDYARQHVAPHAAVWDKEGGVPRDAINAVSEAGFTGGIIPSEFGGGGWDAVTFGLLNEAIGASSSSLCGLFTVQTMVASTLNRWGTDQQKEQWLNPMAKGDVLAAFAMTEPKTGSDTNAIETRFTADGDGYLLNGTKKYITYSGIADIILVFGKDTDDKSMAAIIRKDTPGMKIIPLTEMMGFRGSYLSKIEFDNCKIEPTDLVGKPGYVLAYVAPYGLHWGRISTAWHSAGLLRACMETSATYASQRRAFGEKIQDLGMIRTIITGMGADLEAAANLCLNASIAEDSHSPKAIEKTLTAKYFGSRAAVHASANTIQIMGAAGCDGENNAARYYRNAKILEIIEGTNQVLEKVLGKNFCRKHNQRNKK